MYEPLVSIIIPTFNREGVIENAVRSCLGQTYNNIEVIIVDDASFDNTSGIVTSINDGRIKYFRHTYNKGPAAARNTGLANANGEYIAFLDSDDEWLSLKVQIQLNAFRVSSVDPGLVLTNGYNCVEKTNFLERGKPSGVVYDPHRDNFFPLRVLSPFPSSWMLPSEAVKSIGYFDEEMRDLEDDDYLARAANAYPVYFINESLVVRRVPHKPAIPVSFGLISSKEKFLENNLEEMKKDKGYLFKFYREISEDAIRIDRDIARKYLLKAFLARPYDFSTLSRLMKIIC